MNSCSFCDAGFSEGWHLWRYHGRASRVLGGENTLYAEMVTKAQAPLGATLDLHQRVKGVLEICWGRLVLLYMILVAHLSRSCGGALIHRLPAMEVEDEMGNQPKFQYEKHPDFQVPTRARFFLVPRMCANMAVKPWKKRSVREAGPDSLATCIRPCAGVHWELWEGSHHPSCVSVSGDQGHCPGVRALFGHRCFCSAF